jgi:hypothetical protein
MNHLCCTIFESLDIGYILARGAAHRFDEIVLLLSFTSLKTSIGRECTLSGPRVAVLSRESRTIAVAEHCGPCEGTGTTIFVIDAPVASHALTLGRVDGVELNRCRCR